MAEKAILRQAQDEGVGLAIIPQQPLPLILEFFARVHLFID
jgi:hypothetical protein